MQDIIIHAKRAVSLKVNDYGGAEVTLKLTMTELCCLAHDFMQIIITEGMKNASSDQTESPTCNTAKVTP